MQVVDSSLPPPLPPDYPRFLAALKERIRAARFRAALAVNRELIALYWDLGYRIVEKQERERWGARVIEQAARDLREEFPGMSGLSASNIWRMRAFYRAWSGPRSFLAQPVREMGAAILPQPVAELPWGHNVALLEKLKSRRLRLWYAGQAFAHGWPRSVLLRQIEARLHARRGKAQTNFALTLPAPQAKLAQAALKDEYALDFLAPGVSQEKDIEQGIVENAQRFLMELGKGFALVGRQLRLKAGSRDYLIDLVLYNILLHCYVVVELKAGPFQAEYVGKVGAYLAAADKAWRREGDNESIGMILCRSKDRIEVEYVLRDQRRPIGVACYRLTRELPGPMRKALPTAREIADGLGGAPR